MISLEINNVQFFVKKELSVLESCKYIGIIIPRFCYHENLSIAGNCRMCLVEISNSPKPVASCALPVLNNMKVFVDTPLVKKARENVLEALLLNHPLDCPICDQAGECDLQDQAKVYGSDFSRFFVKKRGVEDKDCGPLIKTIMTRCIHCTRCVRFGTEFCGVEHLGTLNRGGSTEIGAYMDSFINSEISGNVIDLCPVGALTSKPYAFKARPWELRVTEGIDLLDNTGSNIYINHKESEISRILPKINVEINGNIISDKVRFSYDAYRYNRLERIFLRKENKFSILSISSFRETLKSALDFSLFVIDSSLDITSLNLLRKLSYISKGSIQITSLYNKIKTNFAFNSFSNKIIDLNNVSEMCFLIGCNTRLESAILNSKLRNLFMTKEITVISTSLNFKSNFPMQYISLSFLFLLNLLEARKELSIKFLHILSPVFFVNKNLDLRGLNSYFVRDSFCKHIPTSVFYNLDVQPNTDFLDIINIRSVTTNQILKSKKLNLINLAEIEIVRRLSSINPIKFKSWFNTHGFNREVITDLIIPINSEYEEEKFYLNLEGRPQKTSKIFNPLKDSRSLKVIIEVIARKSLHLSSYLCCFLDSLDNPSLFTSSKSIFLNLRNMHFAGILSRYPVKPLIEDFYLSNKISKNSYVMTKSSQEYRKSSINFLS